MEKVIEESYDLYQDEKVYVIIPMMQTHEQRVLGVNEKVEQALNIALNKLKTKSMKVAFSLQRNNVNSWTRNQLQLVVDFCLENHDRATIVPDFISDQMKEVLIELVRRSEMFEKFLEGLGMDLQGELVNTAQVESKDQVSKFTGSPVDIEGEQVDGLVIKSTDGLTIIDDSLCVLDESKRYEVIVKEVMNR